MVLTCERCDEFNVLIIRDKRKNWVKNNSKSLQNKMLIRLDKEVIKITFYNQTFAVVLRFQTLG